jgi:hypothetical protein
MKHRLQNLSSTLSWFVVKLIEWFQNKVVTIHANINPLLLSANLPKHRLPKRRGDPIESASLHKLSGILVEFIVNCLIGLWNRFQQVALGAIKILPFQLLTCMVAVKKTLEILELCMQRAFIEFGVHLSIATTSKTDATNDRKLQGLEGTERIVAVGL